MLLKNNKLARPLAAGAATTGLVIAGLGLGAGAANAQTAITTGHVDAVEIECDANGDIELGVHVDGQSSHDPADFEFVYTEGTGVVFTSGVWEIAENPGANGPSVGFNYEADGASCPTTVEVSAELVSGSGDVRFEAEDGANGSLDTLDSLERVVLGDGSTALEEHSHGEWFYEGSSTGGDWVLQFEAFDGDSGDPIDTLAPFQVTIQ